MDDMKKVEIHVSYPAHQYEIHIQAPSLNKEEEERGLGLGLVSEACFD
jgi:hypothetical protein